MILAVSHLRGAVQRCHRNSAPSITVTVHLISRARTVREWKLSAPFTVIPVIPIKCTVTVISAFLSYLTVRVGFIITEVIRAFQATRRWPISIPKDVCNESSSTSRQKR